MALQSPSVFAAPLLRSDETVEHIGYGVHQGYILWPRFHLRARRAAKSLPERVAIGFPLAQNQVGRARHLQLASLSDVLCFGFRGSLLGLV